MKANLESQYLLENGGRCVRVGKSKDHEPTEKRKFIWQDTSRRQKITIFYGAATTASIYLCVGVPVSFLSRVVMAKGGEKLYAPAIQSSTFLFASISSLLSGNYQAMFSTKTMVWAGLLTVGVSQACLGSLQYIDNVYVFSVVGFLLKATQGIGLGVFSVALLVVLWHEIPEHVEKSFGIIRAMTGAGYLLSAFSGGSLYSIQNGVMLPFVVSSILPIILSFVGWLILPNIEKADRKAQYETWKYICSPKSMLALGLASTCGATFAVNGGSFTSYAQSLGVSVTDVGFMFTVSDACTILVSLIAGCYANTNHTCRQVSMLVCFLSLIAVNLSFTGDENGSLLFLQLPIFVVAAAGVRTLAFPEMIHQSLEENKELKNNLNFRNQLSGVWYFATSVPSFLFGVAGTALQNVVSYSVSETISALVGLLISLITCIIVYLYRRQQRNK